MASVEGRALQADSHAVGTVVCNWSGSIPAVRPGFSWSEFWARRQYRFERAVGVSAIRLKRLATDERSETCEDRRDHFRPRWGSKAIFQGHAANAEAFQRQIDEMVANGKLPTDTDGERIRQDVLADDWDVVPDEKYAMAMSLSLAPELITTFLMKRLTVLRSEAEYFPDPETRFNQVHQSRGSF